MAPCHRHHFHATRKIISPCNNFAIHCNLRVFRVLAPERGCGRRRAIMQSGRLNNNQGALLEKCAMGEEANTH